MIFASQDAHTYRQGTHSVHVKIQSQFKVCGLCLGVGVGVKGREWCDENENGDGAGGSRVGILVK